MSLAYTAPTWEDGTGEGISASNLQAISNCIEGLVQGTDKAVHNVSINGSVITLTYADGTSENFTAVDIKGIVSIEKTATAGLVDTYTITYSDGTSDTFTITNGQDGGGDMNSADYDDDDTVKDAGGIVDYVTSVLPDVSGKADKVTGATSGNFAGLDNNGNLTDSGKDAADFAAASHTHTISQISDYPKTLDSTTYADAGGTRTFSFSDASILTTSRIDYYANVFGVVPTGVTVSSGSLTVEFDTSDGVTECAVEIK